MRKDTMRPYRCYFLNQAGRIEAVEIVDAQADEEALIQAVELLKTQRHYRGIEVWDCARRVFPRARGKVNVDEIRRVLRRLGWKVMDDPSGPQRRRLATRRSGAH